MPIRYAHVGFSVVVLLFLQPSCTGSLIVHRLEGENSGARKSLQRATDKKISLETEGRTKAAEQTLLSLINAFQIIPTDTLRASILSCPELGEVMEGVDLMEWSTTVGKLQKDTLQKGLERHPLLMARAMSSQLLQTIGSMLAFPDEDEVNFMKWRNRLWKEESSLSRRRVRKLLHFFRSKLKLTKVESRNLVRARPKLLRYKNLEGFEEIVDFLSQHVGLKNVASMVKRWPILLTYPVETRIEPGVAFLQSLGESRWERVLIKYPQVLTHPVDTFLQPKLLFLEDWLDIPSSKQLVTHYPPLLWLSTDLLMSKFEYLQSALDLTKQEAEILVETYPQVLGLSVEKNLTPKIAFLRTYLSVEELRDFCLYQPALLAYSLANRIQPRIEQMESANIRFAYAPAYLMSLPEPKFQHWLMLQSSSWSLT